MNDLRESESLALIKADNALAFAAWITAHPEEMHLREKSTAYRAIHYAARCSPECLRILINNGAKLNGASGGGVCVVAKCRPILVAARHGILDSMRILLDAGDDVDYSAGPNGYSALHYAAHENNVELLDYLIDRGAEVDTT